MFKRVISAILAITCIFVVYYWYQKLENFTDKQNSSPSMTTQSTAKPAALGEVKKPETELDTLEAVDYAKSKNKDAVGWIRIPNTTINNSVMQSNNNAYYLSYDEMRKPNVFGSLFLDYECSLGTRDAMSVNTIIYGHSDLKDNPDGPRFSQLFNFTDEEFARKTPYIYFSTSDEEMVWEVFAVSYTDTSMKYIYPYIDSKELLRLVGEAKQKSIYLYDVEVGPMDKILTLSTCTAQSGESKDQRLIVMAKLLSKEQEQNAQAVLARNVKTIE